MPGSKPHDHGDFEAGRGTRSCASLCPRRTDPGDRKRSRSDGQDERYGHHRRSLVGGRIIGGRKATDELMSQLEVTAPEHVLDVGSGLGGPARFIAERYKCRDSGVDLTRDYVETGNRLCQWVGLDDRVSLHQSSALATPRPRPCAVESISHAHGQLAFPKLACASAQHRPRDADLTFVIV